MMYSEMMRLEQARIQDEHRMIEQLSAQARDVVEQHDRQIGAHAEQHAEGQVQRTTAEVWHEARNTVAAVKVDATRAFVYAYQLRMESNAALVSVSPL